MNPTQKGSAAACLGCGGCEVLVVGAMLAVVAAKFAPRLLKRAK